ncbi:MAG TPA: site-2 protease family protein [Thermoanaerobaculia bacterium]|nr:site-2 protease family protein [Thermoanaerobaculia bacterium]
MFGRGITLFKLFGFAVRIDLSWLIIAALITWSLAVGVFPQMYPDLAVRTYWIMGIAGALALFLSIIIHEFSHALVARRYGLQMKGITLFIFGGVAEMTEEPPSPKVELLMAIAGPIASVFLAAFFFVLGLLGGAAGWRQEAIGVFSYLALVNIVLVIFNLVPAFPLDGGRVLRSLLWMWKGNIRWATRIASQSGSVFGMGLMILGIVSVFSGNLVGGLWWFLIGMFLRNAAVMSYQQILVRQLLEGEPVSRFMITEPVTVPRHISVRDLVEDYVYKYHHKMYPVVDEERLVGCVTTKQIKELPRDEWDRQTVGTLAAQCSEANTIPPDADAMKALAKMSSTKTSRLMVVDRGKLVGILSLKDLMNLLSVKLELEGEGRAADV